MLQITHTTLNNNNTHTDIHAKPQWLWKSYAYSGTTSSRQQLPRYDPSQACSPCWHMQQYTSLAFVYTRRDTCMSCLSICFYIYFTGIHRILYLESSVTRGLTCKIFTYCLPRNMYRKLLLWMCCAIMGEWYDHCLFFWVSLFSQIERQKFFF